MKQIKILDKTHSIKYQKQLSDLLKEALNFFNNKKSCLSIILISSLEMAEYNRYYRKKNYATDVLSFKSEIRNDLGDIIICPEVIKKNATERDVKFIDELFEVIIHGFLHLLNYTHDNEEKKKEMFNKQNTIINLNEIINIKKFVS